MSVILTDTEYPNSCRECALTRNNVEQMIDCRFDDCPLKSIDWLIKKLKQDYCACSVNCEKCREASPYSCTVEIPLHEVFDSIKEYCEEDNNADRN